MPPRLCREEEAGVDKRVYVIRVEVEGSPVLGLGPHRVALVCEEFAELDVRADGLRVEDEGSPVLGLGPYRVAFSREEESRL